MKYEKTIYFILIPICFFLFYFGKSLACADGLSFETPWSVDLEEFYDPDLGIYTYDDYTISNVDKSCNGNIIVSLTDSSGTKQICSVATNSSCKFTVKPQVKNVNYLFTVSTTGSALICNQDGVFNDVSHCVNLTPGSCGYRNWRKPLMWKLKS